MRMGYSRGPSVQSHVVVRIIRSRDFVTEERERLLTALYGESYSPIAKCPKCQHKLSSIETLEGFVEDVNDTTTMCPKCHQRFQPTLDIQGVAERRNVDFLCAIQTLDSLKKITPVNVDQFKLQYPSTYHSAVYHFGRLKNAYDRLNTRYVERVKSHWREKINPFLGRLTDTTIAEVVGVTPQTIGAYRRKLGISRFTKAKAIENGWCQAEKQ